MLKKTLNEFITQLKINLESKNYIESISLLLSAIEQYPKEYNLKLNLGNVYKLLGKTNDAINTYNSLLQTPLESIAHNNLSLIQLENGDYKKSIQHAREALKIDGNYNDARYNLAIALFENKEFKESLSLCVKLKEDNFYSNKAYELKCRIQQLICDWSEYDENNKLLRSNQVIAHPFLHISNIDDEESNYNNSLLWNNEGNPNYIERYDKYNSDKVNLGFFCGEIRNHPTFYLIKNLFKNLNRDIFSVYMFSYNHTSDEKKYIEKDEKKLIRIFNIYKKDISKYQEMVNISEIYFNSNFDVLKNEIFDQEFNNCFKNFLDLINSIKNWEYDVINSEIKDFLKKNNLKFPILGKPIRFLLTNNYNGPSITDIFVILGKEQSIKRLNKYKV